MKKLSVLLATTDQLAPSYKNGISDTAKFFNKNQGAFKGYKKTYAANPDTVDDPTKRGNLNIITTVEEKLTWITESSEAFINALFSQEATNASGHAKAELIIGDKSFGMYSTLELMRLKSLLENSDLVKLYTDIPVREETKTWKETELELYQGRKVFEDGMLKGDNNTTEKDPYILQDPNVAAALAAGKTFQYTPVQAVKTKTVKLGEWTSQNFTGEASHRERAEILRRLSQLKTAVLEALKTANDVESIESDMTASKLFNFLHVGTL